MAPDKTCTTRDGNRIHVSVRISEFFCLIECTKTQTAPLPENVFVDFPYIFKYI